MKLLIHDEDIDQSSLDNGDDCIKYNVFSSLEELDAISPNSCKEITFVEVMSDETPHHCPMCGHPVNFESDGYDEEDDY